MTLPSDVYSAVPASCPLACARRARSLRAQGCNTADARAQTNARAAHCRPAASFLSRQAIDVLYWKDQKVTAGILGTGVMLYFLTSLRGYSYVALLSIVLLMHLLISIVMVQVSRLQGKIVPEGKPLQLDADVLKAGVEHVNKALLVYHSLLTCKDMAAAGKAMGGLWILYCLGTWFDGATLLLLVWVGAFSVPIGYEKNKKEVQA